MENINAFNIKNLENNAINKDFAYGINTHAKWVFIKFIYLIKTIISKALLLLGFFKKTIAQKTLNAHSLSLNQNIKKIILFFQDKAIIPFADLEDVIIQMNPAVKIMIVKRFLLKIKSLMMMALSNHQWCRVKFVKDIVKHPFLITLAKILMLHLKKF